MPNNLPPTPWKPSMDKTWHSDIPAWVNFPCVVGEDEQEHMVTKVELEHMVNCVNAVEEIKEYVANNYGDNPHDNSNIFNMLAKNGLLETEDASDASD